MTNELKTQEIVQK